MKKRGTSIPSSSTKKNKGRHWLRPRIVLLLGLVFLVVVLVKCGQRATEPEAKANQAPSIALARILPESPTVENQLNVTIQAKDPEDDPITYEYQWLKNDKEIPGETKGILKPGNFRKGDLVRVRIVPSDGKSKGPSFTSPPVRVINALPTIEQVTIEPKIAYANTPLKALVKSRDPDGDPVYLIYQWEKNGVVLSEERSETLEGRFKKGDSISVLVTPDDRDALGSPKRSETIVISNSPPAIISSPPSSLHGSTYLYQVRTTDLDQDPITYALRSRPKGMEIDQKTGLIRWEVQREDQGTHTIEIEASDDSGAKSVQRYSLSVEFR